jgi:hypothetical protein
MTILEFFSEHYFLAFFTIYFIAVIIEGVFYKLPKYISRHLMISRQGYPPPHCDADGDFKKEDKDNEPN